jgi:prevent-host-death family protein
MQRTIPATELEHNVRSILREVAESHISCVVTERDEPEAVLVPYDEYLRFQRLQRDGVWERIERLQARMMERDSEWTDDEIAADVEEARREIAG